MARDLSSETWYKHSWRPTTAWVYLLICLFDFLIAPILTGIFYAKYGGTYVAWKPITLAEGGMFHLAFGAILGVTSWSRGKEILEYNKTSSYEPHRSSRIDPACEPDVDKADPDFRDNILNKGR